MTEDQFLKNEVILNWWRDVVEHPNYKLVKEQSLRMRRFLETFISPHPHLDHKAHGYKDGYRDCLENMELIIDAEFRRDMLAQQQDELFQDDYISQKVDHRFQ